MRKMYKRSALMLLATCLFAGTLVAQKTWDRGAGTNNWGDANNWNPNGVPAATDAVTIPDHSNFKTIVVNVDASCASLTMSSGNDNCKLTINAGRTLNVAGAVNIGSPSGFLMAKELAVEDGNLNCGSLTLNRTTGFLAGTFFTIDDGTATVAGNLVMNGSLLENFLLFTGNGTLRAGANISGGVILPGDGTVHFNGAAAQVIPNYIYNNLSLGGGGAKTLGSNRYMTGNLLLEENTSLHLGNYHLTMHAYGNRTATINGHLHINGSGRLSDGGNGSRHFVLGPIGYLWLTGAGTTMPAFDTYDVHGNSVVEYGASGNQAISSAPKYGNLVTGGSGTKTISGSFHAINSLVIAANTTLATRPGFADEIQMGGTWVNNGNFLPYDDVVIFKGSAAQFLFGTNVTTFNNVTMNSPNAGIILGQSIVVNGHLNMTHGNIVTSAANTLTLTDNATTSGASDFSYISGPMTKIGNDAFVFPVGKAGNGYHPIGISAPSSSSAAFVAEYIRASAAPLGPVTAGSISSVSDCEYWTLNQTAGASNVNVTLSWNTNSPCSGNYVTDMNDVWAAGFNGGSWNVAGRDVVTGNTTTGTVTMNGVSAFNSFALGFLNAARSPFLVTSVDPVVDPIAEIKGVAVYPNPVRGGQINLRSSDLASGNYTLRVYNSAGQQVTTMRFNHAGGAVTKTIALPRSTQSGMYMLQLDNGATKVLGRSFIVQQ